MTTTDQVAGTLLRPLGVLSAATAGAILSTVASLGGEERFTLDLSGVTDVAVGGRPALLSTLERLRRRALQVRLTGATAVFAPKAVGEA